MTNNPDLGYKIIGAGEAAALAMAKECGGIIASNNLKDISGYICKYRLKHVTTADIMIEALRSGYINESQGNKIWNNMLLKYLRILRSDTTGSKHIFVVLNSKNLSSDKTRHTNPVKKRKYYEHRNHI